MAFVIVLETILISMVSSTLSISKLTSTIIVPMIIWHGPRYGCGESMGVLNMFGMGRPMGAVSHGRVLNMFGMGRPTAAATQWACA